MNRNHSDDNSQFTTTATTRNEHNLFNESFVSKLSQYNNSCQNNTTTTTTTTGVIDVMGENGEFHTHVVLRARYK